MTRLGILFIIAAGLSLMCSQSTAHGTGTTHEAATAEEKPALEIEIAIDQSANAPVVQIQHGAFVHLSISGAGNHELHFHGYDITADADTDGNAMFVFHALRTGRFAIVAHGIEDLLGRKEKAVAYVEVRDP